MPKLVQCHHWDLHNRMELLRHDVARWEGHVQVDGTPPSHHLIQQFLDMALVALTSQLWNIQLAQLLSIREIQGGRVSEEGPLEPWVLTQ